jgi:hypothetical protein
LFAFGRVSSPANLAGDLVGTPIEILCLDQFFPPLSFEFDEPVDLLRDSPMGAIPFDRISVFNNKFSIKHVRGCRGMG